MEVDIRQDTGYAVDKKCRKKEGQNDGIQKGKTMVRHVILWQLKDEFSEAEKQEKKAAVKAGLEGLAGQIPGLISIQVYTEGLPSSNADMMLDSCFADAAALKGYSAHPAHVAVADGAVRPNVKARICLDFEV